MFKKSPSQITLKVLSSLKRIIRDHNQLKLFVGVGNVLRSDDGTGVYIAERIKESEHIRVLKAEVSIENYVGKINSIRPDLLIIVDSVFFGEKPGYWKYISVEKLMDYTTNTHNISFKQISEMFTSQVWILGIQPESVAFGEEISPAVMQSADEIVDIINGE